MAIRNTVTDLDATARTNTKAAIAAGVLACRAGTTATTAEETAVIDALLVACKGRGITAPLSILLGAYDSVASAVSFDRAAATACGATDDRSVENT